MVANNCNKKNSDFAIFLLWKIFACKSIASKISLRWDFRSNCKFSQRLIKFRVNEKNRTIYGWDDINTNFHGYSQKDTEDVYSKLKQGMNDYCEGVECPAHILHHDFLIASDGFSTDIKAIVMKNSTLTSFILFKLGNYICDFVGILNSWIILHSKLYWKK